MNFRLFLESSVTTIRHGPEDDKFSIGMMHSSFEMVKERGDLKDFGSLGQIRMLSSSYPRGQKIFFMKEDEPIGFAIVQKKDWPNGPDMITTIYILEQHRRNGIGTAFHKFLMEKGYTLQPDTHQTLAMQGMLRKLSGKNEQE